MTFIKAARLFVVVCLAGFLGYKYVTADPPGYCAAQGRFISDEEFIRTSEALLAWATKEQLDTQTKWAAENPGQRLSSSFWYANSSHESYQRWQDGLEKNRKRPGFIRVVRDDTHTIFRWLWGYQQVQVILNANSGDEQMRYFYDVCGKVLDGTVVSPSAITTTNYLEILNKYSHDK